MVIIVLWTILNECDADNSYRCLSSVNFDLGLIPIKNKTTMWWRCSPIGIAGDRDKHNLLYTIITKKNTKVRYLHSFNLEVQKEAVLSLKSSFRKPDTWQTFFWDVMLSTPLQKVLAITIFRHEVPTT